MEKAKFIKYQYNYYTKTRTGEIYKYKNRFYTIDYDLPQYMMTRRQQHIENQKYIDKQIENEKNEYKPTKEEQKKISENINNIYSNIIDMLYEYEEDTKK